MQRRTKLSRFARFHSLTIFTKLMQNWITNPIVRYSDIGKGARSWKPNLQSLIPIFTSPPHMPFMQQYTANKIHAAEALELMGVCKGTRTSVFFLFYVNKTSSVYHLMVGLHWQLKAPAHNNAIKLCLYPYKRILLLYMVHCHGT